MKICKLSKCTGCGMCADICPKKCISIEYDSCGFYKSCIDEELCVNCNRCKNVCPANYPDNKNAIQKTYKARRTDKQSAIRSTSGGVAAVMSEYVVKNGGVVVGCGFDDNFHLKHTFASTLDELESFKGSKYLQSYTVGIYRQVKEKLSTGETVMFVGTPCQVSALQNFLGKEYDNLYTVDFVCHGVSSRYVFDKYIDSLNHTDAPLSIQFRNKDKGYSNKNSCFELQVEYPEETFSNTTKLGFYYWFASSLSVRESCYKCPFVSVNRPSDITLADYIGNDMDDVDNEIGVSTVFVNSDKGNILMEAVKQDVVLENKDTDKVVKLYNRLTGISRKPSCRKDFFRELAVCDYPTLVRKYDAKKVLPSKMVRRYYAMKRRIRKLFAK